MDAAMDSDSDSTTLVADLLHIAAGPCKASDPALSLKQIWTYTGHRDNCVRFVACHIVCKSLAIPDKIRHRFLRKILTGDPLFTDNTGTKTNLWFHSSITGIERTSNVQDHSGLDGGQFRNSHNELQLFGRGNDAPSEFKFERTANMEVALRHLTENTISKRASLLGGPSGSGKSFIAEAYAKLMRRSRDVVVLNLTGAIDSKSLIGNYFVSKPGEFTYKLGAVAQCLDLGKILIVESLDQASEDVQVMLGNIAEKRKLDVQGGRTIEAAPGFILIATTTSGIRDSLVFLHTWKIVELGLPSPDEVARMLILKYPSIGNHIPLLYTVYEQTKKDAHATEGFHQSAKHDVTLVDFFRWCRRIDKVYAASSSSSSSSSSPNSSKFIESHHIDSLFWDACDVFSSPISDLQWRTSLRACIGKSLSISSDRLRILLSNFRKPRLLETETSVSIGRVTLMKALERVPTSPRVCMTKHFMRLLEEVACAIYHNENPLLVGETGIGKTTAIQYLAHLTANRILPINLSQQSEPSDLVGSFRPVNLRYIAGKLVENWNELFAKTFSSKRNEKFRDAIVRAYHRSNWHRLVQLLRESVKSALEKYSSVHSEPAQKKRKSAPGVRQQWEELSQSIADFEINMDKSAFTFDFVEGLLVTAMRKGHWILLDEVNMATPDILEAIIQVLSQRQILVSERGDIEPITAHPNFRIFAAMNPATDYGKRDIPVAIAKHFTRIYVDSPDSDEEDLKFLIKGYVEGFMASDPRAVIDIAAFYNEAKELAHRNYLSDGAGARPVYSVRTLIRALDFTNKFAPVFGFRASLHEGLHMFFQTALSRSTAGLLDVCLEKHLHSPKGRAQRWSMPTANVDWVEFGKYRIKKGVETAVQRDDYIMTPFIQSNLMNVVRAVSSQKYPILLQGPTSSGKTSMIEYIANLTGHKLIRINNHEHTDLQEYLGNYVSTSDGKLEYKEGLLLSAVRNGHWIVLDELNLAPPDILESINRLLDDNRELLIPETQEIVKPHPAFVLFATQNPAGLYGGRKHLSRAFRNRFVELMFEDIPVDELETILHSRCKIAPSYAAKIVQVYQKLEQRRSMTRIFDAKHGFATLRDLFRWANRGAQNYEQLALDGFMLIGERSRTRADRCAVKEVIEEVMRVAVDEDCIYHLSPVVSGMISNQPDTYKDVIWNKSMCRTFNLIYSALKADEPVLLVGETGSGKTTVAQIVANVFDQEMVTVNAHQNLEAGDLIGSQRPNRRRHKIQENIDEIVAATLDYMGLSDVDQPSKSEALRQMQTQRNKVDDRLREKLDELDRNQNEINCLFEWKDGPLLVAMKEGSVFLIDEISLAEDAVLERLNSVLEGTHSVTLSERPGQLEAVIASPQFKFIATMNPGGDYGKRELSPALRNRFTEIWVPNALDEGDVKDIIAAKLIPSMSKWSGSVFEFSKWFFQTFKSQPFSDLSVSIRDVLSWVSFLNLNTLQNSASRFSEGALLVHVDSLEPQILSPSTLGLFEPVDSRSLCMKKLEELVGESFVYSEPSITVSGGSLNVGPYRMGRQADTVASLAYFTASQATAHNLLKIIRALTINKPILLEGSPGVGKSSMVENLATLLGYSFVRINLSDQTDLMDLFGYDAPQAEGTTGSMEWKEAAFLKAMQEGSWVLLDEMNLASQSVLEGLNACLDHRHRVFVPELGRTFKSHPNFRVFAAQNPHSQGGGRKGLPRSFVNRFSLLYMEEHSVADLTNIVCSAFPKESRDLCGAVVDLVLALQMAVEKREIVDGSPFDFNLRDVFRWIQASRSLTVHKCFETVICSRFRSDHDIQIAHALFKRCFNLDFVSEKPVLRISASSVWIGQVSAPRFAQHQHYDHHGFCPAATLHVLEKMLAGISFGWPIILTGDDTHRSKYQLVHDLSVLLDQPLEDLAASSEFDSYDLIGAFEHSDRSSKSYQLLLRVTNEVRELFMNSSEVRYLECYEKLSILLSLGPGDFSKTLFGLKESLEPLKALEGGEFSHQTLFASWADSIRRLEICDRNNEGAKFEWLESKLLKAVVDGKWVVIEHSNLCSAAVLDRLNSLLETNGSIQISEQVDSEGRSTIYRPHPNFRLFLTSNPNRGDLSRAMRNRCLEIFVNSRTWHTACANFNCDVQIFGDRPLWSVTNQSRVMVKHFGERHVECGAEVASLLFRIWDSYERALFYSSSGNPNESSVQRHLSSIMRRMESFHNNHTLVGFGETGQSSEVLRSMGAQDARYSRETSSRWRASLLQNIPYMNAISQIAKLHLDLESHRAEVRLASERNNALSNIYGLLCSLSRVEFLCDDTVTASLIEDLFSGLNSLFALILANLSFGCRNSDLLLLQHILRRGRKDNPLFDGIRATISQFEVSNLPFNLETFYTMWRNLLPQRTATLRQRSMGIPAQSLEYIVAPKKVLSISGIAAGIYDIADPGFWSELGRRLTGENYPSELEKLFNSLESRAPKPEHGTDMGSAEEGLSLTPSRLRRYITLWRFFCSLEGDTTAQGFSESENSSIFRYLNEELSFLILNLVQVPTRLRNVEQTVKMNKQMLKDFMMVTPLFQVSQIELVSRTAICFVSEVIASAASVDRLKARELVYEVVKGRSVGTSCQDFLRYGIFTDMSSNAPLQAALSKFLIPGLRNLRCIYETADDSQKLVSLGKALILVSIFALHIYTPQPFFDPLDTEHMLLKLEDRHKVRLTQFNDSYSSWKADPANYSHVGDSKDSRTAPNRNGLASSKHLQDTEPHGALNKELSRLLNAITGEAAWTNFWSPLLSCSTTVVQNSIPDTISKLNALSNRIISKAGLYGDVVYNAVHVVNAIVTGLFLMKESGDILSSSSEDRTGPQFSVIGDPLWTGYTPNVMELLQSESLDSSSRVAVVVHSLANLAFHSTASDDCDKISLLNVEKLLGSVLRYDGVGDFSAQNFPPDDTILESRPYLEADGGRVDENISIRLYEAYDVTMNARHHGTSEIVDLLSFASDRLFPLLLAQGTISGNLAGSFSVKAFLIRRAHSFESVRNLDLDPDLDEISRFQRVVSSVQTKARKLSAEFPDNNAIFELATSCSDCLDGDALVPVPRLVLLAEGLLKKVVQWEQFSNSEWSFSEHIAELGNLIAHWHRIELQDWQNLLDAQSSSIANSPLQIWGELYISLICCEYEDKLGHLNVDEFDRKWRTAIQFIESSSIGDFHIRLKVLGTIGKHLWCKYKTKEALAPIANGFRNLVAFYSFDTPLVLELRKQKLGPIEKEMREKATLQRWGGSSLESILQDCKRSRSILRDLLKRQKEALTESVKPHLNATSFSWSGSLWSPDGRSRGLFESKFFATGRRYDDDSSKAARASWPERYQNSQYTARKLKSIAKLSPCSSDLARIGSDAGLRAEALMRGQDKESIQGGKQRKAQKLRLISDTLRTLRQKGLSGRRQLYWLAPSKENHFSRILQRIKSRLNDDDKPTRGVIEIIHLLPKLRNACSQRSPQIPNEIYDRMWSFLEDILMCLVSVANGFQMFSEEAEAVTELSKKWQAHLSSRSLHQMGSAPDSYGTSSFVAIVEKVSLALGSVQSASQKYSEISESFVDVDRLARVTNILEHVKTQARATYREGVSSDFAVLKARLADCLDELNSCIPNELHDSDLLQKLRTLVSGGNTEHSPVETESLDTENFETLLLTTADSILVLGENVQSLRVKTESGDSDKCIRSHMNFLGSLQNLKGLSNVTTSMDELLNRIGGHVQDSTAHRQCCASFEAMTPIFGVYNELLHSWKETLLVNMRDLGDAFRAFSALALLVSEKGLCSPEETETEDPKADSTESGTGLGEVDNNDAEDITSQLGSEDFNEDDLRQEEINQNGQTEEGAEKAKTLDDEAIFDNLDAHSVRSATDEEEHSEGNSGGSQEDIDEQFGQNDEGTRLQDKPDESLWDDQKEDIDEGEAEPLNRLDDSTNDAAGPLDETGSTASLPEDAGEAGKPYSDDDMSGEMKEISENETASKSPASDFGSEPENDESGTVDKTGDLEDKTEDTETQQYQESEDQPCEQQRSPDVQDESMRGRTPTAGSEAEAPSEPGYEASAQVSDEGNVRHSASTYLMFQDADPKGEEAKPGLQSDDAGAQIQTSSGHGPRSPHEPRPSEDRAARPEDSHKPTEAASGDETANVNREISMIEEDEMLSDSHDLREDARLTKDSEEHSDAQVVGRAPRSGGREYDHPREHSLKQTTSILTDVDGPQEVDQQNSEAISGLNNEQLPEEQAVTEQYSEVSPARDDASQVFRACELLTSQLSLQLSAQLTLILEPTVASKMRGDYKTGKRLNMRRIIPYIASDYKRDKIWMRRSKPSKRQYQVMLAIDNSKSMQDSGSVDLTRQSVTLIAKALATLEVGQIAITSFDEEVKTLLSFDEIWNTVSGTSVFRNITFASESTNIKTLIVQMIESFRQARFRNRIDANLWQLGIIISDGICDDHDAIRRSLQEAKNEKIMIVFILIDAIHEKKKNSVLELNQVSFDEGQIRVKSYMEQFAFDYFLVVREVSDLPSLLAAALKQWFGEVSE